MNQNTKPTIVRNHKSYELNDSEIYSIFEYQLDQYYRDDVATSVEDGYLYTDEDLGLIASLSDTELEKVKILAALRARDYYESDNNRAELYWNTIVDAVTYTLRHMEPVGSEERWLEQ